MYLSRFEIAFILLTTYIFNIEANNIQDNLHSLDKSLDMSLPKKLYGCNFEVFGKVQGVFFRKYTEKRAKSLGLRGWCMNTSEGTVKGQLEGPQYEMNEMKHWLQTKGSPKSRIDKAIFSEPKEISGYQFQLFAIRR